ncbi:MAG TPA: PHP domain-containing protein [Candidatus Acidoferrales bacterium]|nr:PHP domain-containing protein [Candidatus Acidoferrales bacterium]
MKLDLHVHTRYSPDSDSPVEAIVLRACEIGLDGIAVTDHNTVKGSLEAEKLVTDLNLNLIIIPGMELSTKEGHLLILGIRDELPPGLSIGETIKMAREKGATIIVPHPYQVLRNGVGVLKGKDIDAIESFNSKFIIGTSNYIARTIAKKRQMGVTGGSDSHKVETIGFGYTIVDASPDASVHDILNEIKDHRSRAEGLMIPHYFSNINSITRFLKRGNKRN